MSRGGDHCRVVWDMGSSLYDSHELASLCQILDTDRHIGADLPPLLHGAPPPPPPPPSPSVGERRIGKVVALFGRRGGRKVTLRALFRAAASWAVRPRKATRGYGCACVGAAPSG
ncbi:hypothetical protein GUJ93_ZPchr0001g32871 [Zizania palustris]|uniref:Uncharacterized protein n=1 Tax=Zizania palustris TaxID=103762 RepID=A0A8J5RS33_ZIZPA|nr:hypothetical protein GUJ93_ZPchr0001g32871 [Zizania palustris]